MMKLIRKDLDTTKLKRRKGVAEKLSSHFFSISPAILLVALIWPFGGGNKVQMMAGTDTPAARGVIALKRGDNGNREFDLKASSLATPSSLQPAENVYVVWLQEPGHEPQNMGQLRVDDHLRGDLHAVTAFRRFKVFITAEQNAQQHTPEGVQVLSAEVASS